MRPLYDLASVFANQIHVAEQEAGRVYEAVIGLVTDNKDPQKLGRVKVKFPVLSMQDTSWWSPIVMLGAGKNRGWFFIPEVDDEVLCIFEHGDVTRPLVVGALWNGKDKPADTNPGGNPRRVIRSRQGSKIIFDDDQMKLVIEDGTGKARITFDSNANKISIEAIEGDVCFQSPKGDMKIVAKSATFTATSNVEIHAGAKMAWGTDASAKINGGGGVTFSGSKVNLNCGIAQAPPAPTANPQDVGDPYEARGAGSSGGGGGAPAASQQSQGAGGGGPAANAPNAPNAARPPRNPPAKQQQPPKDEANNDKPDDPNVYVVHSELTTPGGQPLGFQEVVLVKHGTDEVVAGPATTDKDGKVSFVVPENGQYDLKLIDDEDSHLSLPPPDEEVATHLHCQFIEGGVAAAGETVQVTGEGVNLAMKLGEDGELDLAVAPGEYTITVRDQTFKAHTIRSADFDAGGGYHEFVLEAKEQPGEFERARANRYSPSSRAGA